MQMMPKISWPHLVATDEALALRNELVVVAISAP
jgi:hypothetical protein